MPRTLSRLEVFRIRLLYQHKIYARDAKDSAIAALAAAAQCFGDRLSICKLQSLIASPPESISLQEIADASRLLGFEASRIFLRLTQLPLASGPLILPVHTPVGRRYIVWLCSSRHHTHVVIDPFIGIVQMTSSQLGDFWLGEALALKHTPSVQAAAKAYTRPNLWILLSSTYYPYRWTLSLTLTIAFLLAGVSFLAPLVVGRFFGILNSSRDSSQVIPLLLMLCFIALSRSTLIIARSSAAAKAMRIVDAGLGKLLINKVTYLPLKFYHGQSPANVLSMFEDVFLITRVLTGACVSLSMDIFYLMLGVFSLLAVRSRLLLYVTVYVLCTTAAQGVFQGLQGRRGRMLRQKRLELVSGVVDMWTAIKTIKVFTCEPIQASVLLRRMQDVSQSAASIASSIGQAQATSALLVPIITALLLFSGSKLVIRKELSLGELITIYTAALAFITSLENVPPSLVMLREAVDASERLSDLNEMMDEQSCVIPLPSYNLQDGSEDLRFSNVSFGFSTDRQVLTNACLVVMKGETVGIRGPSGSGKSTLAMLCAGLYRPDTGRIYIAGRDIANWEPKLLREYAAVVFSDSDLVTGSLHDNIIMGSPQATTENVEAAAQAASCLAFIKALPGGIGYRITANSSGLSSGQKQRIALARAILRNPKILILDEATSHLDVETETVVLKNILAQRKGRTTLVISHRPETHRVLARCVTVTDGVVVDPEVSVQVKAEHGAGM